MLEDILNSKIDTSVKGKQSNQKKISKQNIPLNSGLRECSTKKTNVKHRRQQESVNRVDINFSDLFEEEEKPKYAKSSFSTKKNIRKPTEYKQSPGVPMQNYTVLQPKSKMSLAQTIAKAREKRSHYFTSKIAWTGEPKGSQKNKIETQKKIHDNSALFSKVSNNLNYGDQQEESTMGNIEHHNNATLRPDVRFNAILEKLRKTAAEIEPHFK